MTTRKRWSAKIQMEILREYEEKCFQCKQPLSRADGFDLDHAIPLAIGGRDERANLRPLCRKCHRLKTNTDIVQIAKTRRQEQKSWGVKSSKGRGFPKREKIRPSVTKIVPIRPLYRRDV